LSQEEQDMLRRKEAKEDERWRRKIAKEPAYHDYAGWSAGQRAAEKADLGQGRVEAGSGRELE
jgi:hypothetical protein